MIGAAPNRDSTGVTRGRGLLRYQNTISCGRSDWRCSQSGGPAIRARCQREILRTGPESVRGVGGRVVVTETLAYLVGPRGEDLRRLAEGDIPRVDVDAGHGEQRDDRRAERDQAGECGGGAQEMLIRGLGDDVRRRRFSGGQSRRERIAAGQRGGDREAPTPAGARRRARDIDRSPGRSGDRSPRARSGTAAAPTQSAAACVPPGSPSHGPACPPSSSKSSRPTAYRSVCGDSRPPAICSGAIYAGVPAISPVAVVVGETRQAEVGDANLPAAVEHHVGRLQVAMEDAAIVRRGKAGADLSNDLDGLVRRQPADAAQQRRKVFAVHVLHRHERTAVPLADVMNPADIGMRDLAGGARLVAQARRQGGLVAAQELQRDGLAEREIVGAIDLAHAAATEQADDAVARRRGGCLV